MSEEAYWVERTRPLRQERETGTEVRVPIIIEGCKRPEARSVTVREKQGF